MTQTTRGSSERVRELLRARRRWLRGLGLTPGARAPKVACEGGCGVLGLAASQPVAGRYLHRPLAQMNNRGNGKGGGIAVAGCFPERAGHFALQVALLDPEALGEVESRFVAPHFDVSAVEDQPRLDDYRDAGRLQLRPPDIRRWFVRVKPEVLERFAEAEGLEPGDPAEAEFVARNSFELNHALYATEQPRAFVLSQGRNLAIFKAVGFAEDVLRYYRLDELEGNVWIGHQRYPTRGRVWHPGGAHPFTGLDEALVHNGDLANYCAIAEYLGQKGIVPLFLTDTEVAILLFDLYHRSYGYPLEHICEALAPTTERDFDLLPKDRQRIYRALRASHLHGSPDGPFFFILARSLLGPAGRPGRDLQLVGITDTSMLRPQVFGFHQGELQLGLVASEKQAIDAFLEDLSQDDQRVAPQADRYWNARGGSHTDGGTFVFTLSGEGEERTLRCADKFGRAVDFPRLEQPPSPFRLPEPEAVAGAEALDWGSVLEAAGPKKTFEQLSARVAPCSFDELGRIYARVVRWGLAEEARFPQALDLLTRMLDRRYDPGRKKPAALRVVATEALRSLLDALPPCGEAGASLLSRRIERSSVEELAPPPPGATLLAVDARGFDIEGPQSLARLLVRARGLGWRTLVVYRCHGHRFIGCGLGPDSRGIRIEVYGSSGDYLGSGLDGAHIHVHGDAQDQVGQILKSGRIVVHGDVGQTLLYGAKGGCVYVRGNAAGRPLINAVGDVRVIINGTCLDYAAESFMAGPQLGGGFLVINGVTHLHDGRVWGLETKYPGTNLYSLASGGCCYLNDPYHTVTRAQLNGARFDPFQQGDWNVLDEYLSRNQELFGIRTRYDLLMVDGALRWPKEVYRKIVPATAPEPVD